MSVQRGIVSSEAARGGPGGESASPERRDDDRRTVAEIVAIWNGSVFAARHVRTDGRLSPQVFAIGERPDCDLWIPPERLGGRDRVRLSHVAGGRLVVTVLPGASARLSGAEGATADLGDLERSGRAVPSAEIAGGRDVALEPGERLAQDFGEFTFLAGLVPRPRLRLGRSRDRTTPLFVAASLALHVAFLGVAWRYQSTHDGLNIDVLGGGDNPYLQMLVIAPPELKTAEEITIKDDVEAKPQATRDEDDPETPPDVGDGDDLGERAGGDPGRMGDRTAPDVDRRAGVFGPRDTPNPHLARTKLIEEVKSYGALSALAALRSNAPTSPFSPYSVAAGTDPVDARGHLLGTDYGTAYGADGLGALGTGDGGGGAATYRWGLGDLGRNCCGFDPYGDGGPRFVGRGGQLGRSRENRHFGPELGDRTARGPEVRIDPAEIVGTLSRETIRRIVRLHLNRVRHCYEVSLLAAPELGGNVAVRFVIAAQGNVQSAETAANTTGSSDLARCVVDVVRRIVFPQSDGVTGAVYPFLFRRVGDE